MATAADIDRATDSGWGWVAEHVQEYVSSGGEKGHVWNGVPTLVLVTSGQKTGEPRRTALIYGTHGDELVIVASKGGDPADPQWYKNLKSQPEAGVLVGTRRVTVTARVAGPEERGPLWEQMATIWPSYNEYATKTDREIPIVLLTPES